jgi:LPXTG-motif cell wall-anchored protein
MDLIAAAAATPGAVPEAPLAPLLLVAAALVGGFFLLRRRRREGPGGE